MWASQFRKKLTGFGEEAHQKLYQCSKATAKL